MQLLSNQHLSLITFLDPHSPKLGGNTQDLIQDQLSYMDVTIYIKSFKWEKFHRLLS